tara:strand:+ start:236 stop:628 length:393 start_codon:yes stop_codon:yes gene_type:complete
MMKNHLKVKEDYGLETQPIMLDELLFGADVATKTAPTMRRKPRFYSLMEQEIKHPILVWFNRNFKKLEVFNGGLRVMVAVEKGFDSIDGIVSDDIDFLKNLQRVQQNDASNFFEWEDLEDSEKIRHKVWI